LEPGGGWPTLRCRHQRKSSSAIQRFTDDVGVTGVARRLFDQMQENPPNRPGIDILGKPGNVLGNGHSLSQVGNPTNGPLGFLSDLVIQLKDGRYGFVGLPLEARAGSRTMGVCCAEERCRSSHVPLRQRA
jgi:hypothetical protein